jgi:hypothetical protein
MRPLLLRRPSADPRPPRRAPARRLWSRGAGRGRSPLAAACIGTLARGAVRERMLFNRLAEGSIGLPPIEVQRRASAALAEIRPLRSRALARARELDRLPSMLPERVFGPGRLGDPAPRRAEREAVPPLADGTTPACCEVISAIPQPGLQPVGRVRCAVIIQTPTRQDSLLGDAPAKLCEHSPPTNWGVRCAPPTR